MVCQRRPDIDMKETIGLYEFALVHKSMFDVMAILQKLPPRSRDQRGTDSATTDNIVSHLKVIIIDGMAELQSLDKPDWVKNCAHLAEHFVATIEQT